LWRDEDEPQPMPSSIRRNQQQMRSYSSEEEKFRRRSMNNRSVQSEDLTQNICASVFRECEVYDDGVYLFLAIEANASSAQEGLSFARIKLATHPHDQFTVVMWIVHDSDLALESWD
jgi:hypothetical protein